MSCCQKSISGTDEIEDIQDDIQDIKNNAHFGDEDFATSNDITISGNLDMSSTGRINLPRSNIPIIGWNDFTADRVGILGIVGNERINYSISTTPTTFFTVVSLPAQLGNEIDIFEDVRINSNDLYTRGISLATTGGTPTLLDYYEEYSATESVFRNDGISEFFTVAQDVDIKLLRLGNFVTLCIEQVSGTAVATDNMRIGVVPIPVRFRPAVQQTVPWIVKNGTDVVGNVKISTGGAVRIYAGPANNTFTSGNSCFIFGTSFSYCIM